MLCEDPYCDYGYFEPEVVVEEPPVLMAPPYLSPGENKDNHKLRNMFCNFISSLFIVLTLFGLIVLLVALYYYWDTLKYYLFNPFKGSIQPTNVKFDPFRNFNIQAEIVNKDTKL